MLCSFGCVVSVPYPTTHVPLWRCVFLQGTGMMGVPGIASAIFSTVRDAGINVIMISQVQPHHWLAPLTLPLNKLAYLLPLGNINLLVHCFGSQDGEA